MHTVTRAVSFAILASAGAFTSLGAQQLTVSADATIRAALAHAQSDNAWTLDQQVSICEIPAPPFKETVRGQELKRRFESLGLTNVRVDAEGNVIGERRGTGNGPTVVLSGHLDTVFPEGTDVKVKRQGTLLTAPGIGDDCRGLAVMLQTIKAMNTAKIATPGTILFVGTVGEEGPGNLRGVRALFKSPPTKIDYFISIDGTGLGLTSRAVGSHRYRVSFQGPGGHSYGAFGMPNPIHAMGRAIAKISDIKVPAEPRTTFNVGIVEGGTSVNTISPLGAMDVDLRSVSVQELGKIDAQFRTAVAQALREENARWPNANDRNRVTVKIEDKGVRPAGAQSDTAFIVRVAKAAGKSLGFDAPSSPSSTDANIPMSLGIPAITIDGGGQGRGAHSLSESYDDGADGWQGPKWAILITAMLAGKT